MKTTSNPIELLVHGYDTVQRAKHLLDLIKAAEKAKSTYRHLNTSETYEKWQRVEAALAAYPAAPEELHYV